MGKFLLCLIYAIVCQQAILAGTAKRRPTTPKYESAPYHVHMLVYDPLMYKWPGSGVLVTTRHVLTAAINVHNYNRWDLGFGSEQQSNLRIITSFYGFVHEEFNDTTDDNNVGLIVMPENIEITDRIAPVALPQPNERIPNEGDIGHIAAFMFTGDFGPLSKRLEHGVQTILSDAECETVYPHLHGIVKHFFCGSDQQFNACGGAQGTGFTVKRKNKQQILAGIISFGNIWRDCVGHTPSGFIRISEYVNWIRNKTENETNNVFSSINTDSVNMIGYLP